MTRLLPLTLLLALAAAAPANASTRPYRTETQATSYIVKRVSTGTGSCYGQHGRHTGLYRTFVCFTQDWEADTSTAYRLETRPHGRWFLRTLA